MSAARQEEDPEAVKATLTKFIEAFYVDQKKGYFDPPSYFAPITETYYNYHNLTYQGLKEVYHARQAEYKNLQLSWLVPTLQIEHRNDSLIATFWTRQNYLRTSRNAQESGEMLLEMILNTEGKIKSLKELEIRNWVSVSLGRPSDAEPQFASKNSLPAPGESKPKESAEPPVYNSGVLDFPPEFKGGQAQLAKYLNKNIRYPSKARDQHIQGRVFISFIVETNGDLSNLTVIRGIGSGCDEEAVRVLRNSPNWKPGMLDGKAVRTSYVLPIIFQLTD